MKIDQHIVKLICPSSSGSLLTDHCSGAFALIEAWLEIAIEASDDHEKRRRSSNHC